MVSPKSSMGEISEKISSSPEVSGREPGRTALAAATRARHFSLPTSQSKLSVCRARRLGACMGSAIFAKVMRRDAVRAAMSAAVGAQVREAAKGGSFPHLGDHSAYTARCRWAPARRAGALGVHGRAAPPVPIHTMDAKR